MNLIIAQRKRRVANELYISCWCYKRLYHSDLCYSNKYNRKYACVSVSNNI